MNIDFTFKIWALILKRSSLVFPTNTFYFYLAARSHLTILSCSSSYQYPNFSQALPKRRICFTVPSEFQVCAKEKWFPFFVDQAGPALYTASHMPPLGNISLSDISLSRVPKECFCVLRSKTPTQFCFSFQLCSVFYLTPGTIVSSTGSHAPSTCVVCFTISPFHF